MLAAAVHTLQRIIALDCHFAAVFTVPDRDAVPPPQLAADAPVLDVFQPVVIHLGEAVGHDLDLALAYNLEGGFCQRLNAYEPLGGDHRLDQLTTALRAWDGHFVRFFFDHQPGLAHILPELLAAGKAFHSLVRTAIFIYVGILIQHGNKLQVVFLRQGIVVRVMGRGNLQGASAKLARDILVCDHRDLASQDGDDHFTPDVFLVAFILRVDTNSRVPQDRLRARGGYRDVVFRVISKDILEEVQHAHFITVIHLKVRYCCLQLGRPVDHPGTAVDQAFFIKADEGFAYRAG